MKQKTTFFLMLAAVFLLASCVSYNLEVRGVVYQSLASDDSYLEADIPPTATIIVYYNIDAEGQIDVTVKNNTNQMMIIDRTQSFFNSLDEMAIPYYDPTVRVETSAVTSGQTRGATVNLGSVANAAGVGGALGQALYGVNVGGSNTTSVTNTNTTYHVDQPRLSIPPHGTASMGRVFQISGVGHSTLTSNYYEIDPNSFLRKKIRDVQSENFVTDSANMSYIGCSVCIAYSTDEGQHFETVISNFYCNAYIAVPTQTNGNVNEALRAIYQQKPDALAEPWYRILVVNGCGGYQLFQNSNAPIINLNNFGNNGVSFRNYR